MVSYTKFVGVLINDNLTWSDHISILISKVSKNVGVVRRIVRVMPDHVLHSFYVTLIQPYLSYFNIVSATKERTKLKKIVILQEVQFVSLPIVDGIFIHLFIS